MTVNAKSETMRARCVQRRARDTVDVLPRGARRVCLWLWPLCVRESDPRRVGENRASYFRLVLPETHI